jgi:tetratricopeptide (TPR) repeat protein
MHPGAFGSRGTAAIVALCVAGAPSVSHAQDDEAKKKRALALYEAATQAYGEAKYREAADLLAKAFVYDNNLIYQYNRILALQANGDYAEALEELEFYEDIMMEDGEKRFSDVPEIKAKLQGQVEAEKIKNASKDPEDPKDPVDPKDPEDPKDPVDPVDPVEPKPAGNVLPTVGYVLVGAGGLALATGGLIATGLFYEAPAANATPAEILAAEDAFAAQTTASVALLVGGAVLAGTGAVLLVVGGDDSEDSSTAWTITPYVGPDGGGAAVFGRF